MAVTDIDVGTVANDGTGQTLRAAFQRVNSNYYEFYSQAAGTVKPLQVNISPAGATPTDAEIEYAFTTAAEDATGCIFILNDLTNNKVWFGLSNGTNYHIVSMTKIAT